MKKVSVVDTATQNDPITHRLCSSIKFNKHKQSNRRTAKTKSSNKQRNQKSNKDTYRGEKAEVGLKKATIEMIKKDLKKQQQKERQARSHSSPSRKDQTKIKI